MECISKTSRGINKAQEIEPIKNVKDIAKIKQYLLGKQNKRDYMLLVVGINIGLRAVDLLELRIQDVLNELGQVRSGVRILEKKTQKYREFTLNKSVKDAIELYINSIYDFRPEDYLFSRRKLFCI